MTEPRRPIDQLLDVLVYGPLGLALTVRDELPQLVEKGRDRVTGQLTMARMIGQFAVQTGQKEAERLVREAVDRLADVASGTPPPPAASSPSAPAAPAAATDGGHDDGEPARPAAPAGDRRPDGELAIPGYDNLSASQVVQRLPGLSLDELDAVEAYERATRGRRTILNRVAQLRAG